MVAEIFQKTNEKLDEYDALSERLSLYQNVLLKKGIQIARQKGLTTAISSSHTNPVADIVLSEKEGDVNILPLIELAREAYPGIYKTYVEKLERHNRLVDELEDIREDLMRK